jgi:hypothetical protein
MQLSSLTNAELDAAYEDTFSGLIDTISRNQYGAEIRARQASVNSFLYGLIGVTSFPRYEARNTQFQQVVAAQGSVADTVKTEAAAVGNAALSTVKVLGIAVFILLAGYVYLKGKK